MHLDIEGVPVKPHASGGAVHVVEGQAVGNASGKPEAELPGSAPVTVGQRACVILKGKADFGEALRILL